MFQLFSRQKKAPHIFLHLHKCGGTTLMQSIDVNYNNNNIYPINGSRYRDSYDEFKNLSVRQRNKIDLLRGHHFFGSHEYLREGATYFTMMREPMSRLASLYNYLREIDLYKEINQKDLSIAQFLDSGLAMAADNGMVRMLTNNDFLSVPNGNITVNIANEAIENLKNHFTVIGIMEEFEKSMEVFQNKLEWKGLPKYTASNKTTKKLVTTKDMKLFFQDKKEYYKYIEGDMIIYDYALQVFNNY